MKPGNEPAPGDEELLRARVLLALVPVAVHRLGNHLAVVQATLALGLNAHEADRDQAARRVTAIRGLMARLEALARGPQGLERPLGKVVEGQAELLELLAHAAGVELDVRLHARSEAVVDDAFEGLLLAAGAALLWPAPRDAARPLRLALRAVPGGLSLTLARGGAPPARRDAAPARALAAHATSLGWSVRERAGRRSLALRMTRPAEGVESTAPVHRRAPRVALVWDPGEERELVGTVLREQGWRIVTLDHADEARGGPADLVLVAEPLEAAEPGLAARLRRRHGESRVEVLPARPSPTALLALLGDLRARG